MATTLSRWSHAHGRRQPDRPDPIALLEEQAKARVPEMVPIRRGRMMVSPFTFYRGAPLPMASDLSRTPASGLAVQACGDAHLSNFGIFGSPERLLVFDVNDFDETTPGPWEWDVKRLAASLKTVPPPTAPEDCPSADVLKRPAPSCQDQQSPGMITSSR